MTSVYYVSMLASVKVLIVIYNIQKHSTQDLLGILHRGKAIGE
jgi:hypothetical protein